MLGDTDTDSASYARACEKSTSELADDEGKRDAATGRFLPGNCFWTARASSGPAPKFADGEALWKACVEYFDWVNENPLYKDHIVAYRGKVTHVPVPKMRPMSKSALCQFLGIERSTWNGWKKDRPDLDLTIERVESVIWDWQFTGAAAGLLDAGMVIRQLKL
jgi:hypothetical protein